MHELSLRQMLDYAMLAYSNTPTSPDFEQLEFENCDNGVQYFIGENEGTLIISFRGTDSLKDWLTDLHFWKKTIPYGGKNTKIRIHSGFLKAYLDSCVCEKIKEHVTPQIKNIYITGHSFGAALALICAIDLQNDFPEKAYEVAVFGCPRVGNKAFAKAYNKRIIKTIRIQNGNDLVTKVPPAIFGFCHAGIKVQIGFPRILGLFSIRRHCYRSYYGRLWKARRI